MPPMRYAVLLLVGLPMAACQRPAVTLAGERQTPAPTDAAKLKLSELPPPVDPPVNAAGSQQVPEAARKLLAQAEELAAKGQHGKAIPVFEKAREAAPDSPRVLRGLGLCYGILGEAGKAQQFLDESMRTAPGHVRAQLVLGQYALLAGDAKEGAIRFRKALLCPDAGDDNPDTAEVCLRLGALLEQQGYYRAAGECYRKLGRLIAAHGHAFTKRSFLRALVLQPERCMIAEGKMLMKLGEHDRAARVLERAYRRDKAHPDAARLAVQALLSKRDFQRAEAIVLEMIQEPALRAKALPSALALCQAAKDPGLPVRLLGVHLRGEQIDSGFVVAMSKVATKLGSPAQLVELVAGYVSAAPGDKAVAIQLARLYLRSGDLNAAGERLARLLATDEQGAWHVRTELARLARTPVKRESIEALAATAEKAEPKLKPAILCVAGMLAAQTENNPLAVELLRLAVRADARFWPAYEALEEVYVAARDFTAVKALIREVAKVAKEGYFRFYLIGKSQLDRGQYASAVDNLEQARARKAEHVPTLLLLGRAYARGGKFRDAERRLLAAMALAPHHAAVAGELFDLYAVARRQTEASRVARRFCQDNPGSIPGQIMLARHHRLVNRTGQAREILRRLASEAPDDVEVRLFELELDLPQSLEGDPLPAAQADLAIGKARDILRLDPRNAQAGKLYAALLANQRRHAEAAKALEKLHARKPRDARIADAYLKALIKAERRRDAVRRIEEIARMEFLDTAMRRVVLDRLVELEQFDKAEHYAEQWLSDPTDQSELSVRRFRALEVYRAAKHFDKAQRLLDTWIADRAGSDLVGLLRREKVRTFALAGKFDDAVAYARSWLKDQPEDTQPKIAVVAALLEAEAHEKALALVDEYLAAGGEDSLVEYLRKAKLLCCAELDRFDDLMKFARSWIAQEPESDEPGRVAMAVLVEQKQYDKALQIASERLDRLEKSDDSAEGWARKVDQARRLLVQILLLAERKEDALKRVSAWAEAHPKDPGVHKLLASVLSSMGKEGECLVQLEKVYQLDPDEAGINNDLGYSWADRGIHLPKAESMIRKALRKRPNEIAFKDSLGWVLYKQGRFREAREVFDQVADADEEDLHAIILDHAGDTCWRLGLTEEAIRLWARAVALAGKQEKTDKETGGVLKNTPRKIADGKQGGKPKVAPLGKGVPQP